MENEFDKEYFEDIINDIQYDRNIPSNIIIELYEYMRKITLEIEERFKKEKNDILWSIANKQIEHKKTIAENIITMSLGDDEEKNKSWKEFKSYLQ